MYDGAALGTGGVLASTGAFGVAGLAFDAVWVFLAAFAVLSGLMALARVLPRRT